MNKTKILWVGEASYLNSGYANYSREILTRLHNSGKFEVAELAGYGKMTDPRVKSVPWKFYANQPEDDEPQEIRNFYKSKVSHEFGEWRFDKTLLDFRPKVVASIRDPWMDSFIQNSHLRRYYSAIMMPTADSVYLQPDWLNTYSKIDGILTYTEWSKKLLDEESGGKINTLGAAPYGIDYDAFSPPENKAAHKERFGISGDSIIFGTVMRNQKRKLFPDLIQAFANAIDKMPESVAKRCYLYLHTSYPDKQCWDIPRLIIEAGIGTKTLVSYICKVCKRSHSAIFQDARARCPHCNNTACILPNVGFGHTEQQLVDVYRLFDLYIQYSISEGFGCPQIEAAACGVPLATVDFSAMQDVGLRLNAYLIPVERYFREFESHMLRAYPSNAHLTDLFVKFAQLPGNYRAKLGQKTRALSQEYFNWDRVYDIWEQAILGLPEPKREWTAPPDIQEPAKEIPEGCSNGDLINYLFNKVYIMPEMRYNLSGIGLLRDLNLGATVTSQGVEHLDKKKVVERLRGKQDGKNIAERARCGLIKLHDEKFIQFANNRNVKHE